MLNKEKIIIYVSVITTFLWTLIVLWIKFDFDIRELLFSSTIVSLSIFISLGIIWLIRNYLWRLKFTKHIFGNYPDLNGEWEVKRRSYDSEETSIGNLTIKQKWDSISICYGGEKSVNVQSELSYFGKYGNNYTIMAILIGSYKTDLPKNLEREGENKNAIIIKYSHNTDELNGEYWTYTKKVLTQGYLHCKRKPSSKMEKE